MRRRIVHNWLHIYCLQVLLLLLLCLPRGSERKHHCLISDPRTLSQLLPHHHKGGASPGITLHILPHCTEGSPQSASHWACLCLTQNI